MAVKLSLMAQSRADPEESPAKRPRMMNTPPAEANEPDEMDHTPIGIVNIKANLVSGNEGVLAASWARLLRHIREEVRATTQTGPTAVPVIDFKDLNANATTDLFLRDLKIKGAAIIRNVIPVGEAAAWMHELDSYLRDNPHTMASPAENPELYELFWSLAQLNARAHPNMLAAQKLVMKGCWHHSSTSRERLSSNFPVMYADRVRMTHKSLRGSSTGLCKTASPVSASARAYGSDGEQWETDGCSERSATATYRKIWSGNWEDYNPWDTSPRLDEKDEAYNDSSTSGAFKMFEGVLPLSMCSNDDDPLIRFCPLSLKPATAYRLLRPLFSPKRPLKGNREDFLDPSNWILDTAQNPLTHAARSSFSQEINDIFPVQIQPGKTSMPLPPLHPGDYVIWHPDTLHTTPNARPQASTPSSPPPLQASRPHTPQGALLPPAPSTLLYLPACPLTLPNAKYLAQQRRAFLLGFPGPDFATTHEDGRADLLGESYHMGRPGVQEINEAGGEEALRAMGLLAWEEEDGAAEAGERRLLKMANAVLFPDRVVGR